MTSSRAEEMKPGSPHHLLNGAGVGLCLSLTEPLRVTRNKKLCWTPYQRQVLRWRLSSLPSEGVGEASQCFFALLHRKIDVGVWRSCQRQPTSSRSQEKAGRKRENILITVQQKSWQDAAILCWKAGFLPRAHSGIDQISDTPPWPTAINKSCTCSLSSAQGGWGRSRGVQAFA